MRIISDIDGVVLNYFDSASEWAETYFKWKKTGKPNGEDFVDIYGITKDEAEHVVQAFSTTYRYGHLPPQDDARAVIRELHDTYGLTIDFITAAPDAWLPRKLREQNLINVVDESAINSVQYSKNGTKVPELSKFLGKELVYIDDHPRHCAAARNLGFKTFIYDRPWNQHSQDFDRVYDWDQLAKELIAFEKLK